MPTPILIQSVSRATVLFSDVERFSKTKIVLESRFVFSGHGIKNHRVIPVHRFIAELFVGGQTRVLPYTPFSSFLVLLTTNADFPRGLTNIFFATRTIIAVNSFLFLKVLFWCAFSAEDVAKFLATFMQQSCRSTNIQNLLTPPLPYKA